MKKLGFSSIMGFLLVTAGVLLLLHNFGFLEGARDFVWTLFFALGGLAFLAVFLGDRAQWWAVIPGLVLLSLAVLIGVDDLDPRFTKVWGGSIFLGGIGLSFWIIYLTQYKNWWAIVPGGVLFTLALIAGLSSLSPGLELGGVFFLGLACTFGAVYLLPKPEGRMNWALIPAGILFVMGTLLTAAATDLIRYIWPAMLILVGIILVVRTLRASN